MKIEEIPDKGLYKVSFFPNAVDSDITKEEEGIFNGVKDKWAEKGFLYKLGTVDGQIVPKYAVYDAKRYTIGQVTEAAKGIRSCAVCKSLNKYVDIVQEIKIKDSYQLEAGVEKTTPEELELLRQLQKDVKELKQEKQSGKNIVQNMLMESSRINLTPAGRIVTSLITDDEGLLESLIPEGTEEEKEAALLMAQASLADYFAGDEPLYQSKPQIKMYSKLKRERAKALVGEPVEIEEEEKPKKKMIGSLIVC